MTTLEELDIAYVEVDLPQFCTSIHVYIGIIPEGEGEKIDKHIDKVTDCEFGSTMEKASKEYDGIAMCRGRHNVVWCEEYSLGILSHELLHAIFNIAAYVGISHKDESEEFYTYTMGYVMKYVDEAYKERETRILGTDEFHTVS